MAAIPGHLALNTKSSSQVSPTMPVLVLPGQCPELTNLTSQAQLRPPPSTATYHWHVHHVAIRWPASQGYAWRQDNSWRRLPQGLIVLPPWGTTGISWEIVAPCVGFSCMARRCSIPALLPWEKSQGQANMFPHISKCSLGTLARCTGRAPWRAAPWGSDGAPAPLATGQFSLQEKSVGFSTLT